MNYMSISLKKDVDKKKNGLPKFLKFLENKDSLFYYFIFLVILGVGFLIVALVYNDFTTPFSGDYVAQQFSFYINGYDDWHHFFKTGEFVLYDSNTFLGANNIGSNSFYYLFDPFFLPILLFPRVAIPQGMAILTILKLSLSGLAFFAYMRYLGVKRETAKITGIAYAFSGWVAWYLWFNHFTEISICFPLILLGIEKVIKEKNPTMLGASIFLLGITNFFFLIPMGIASFIYAMWRFFQKLKTRKAVENWKVLGFGAIGFISGLLMSCIVVLPAVMVALTSSRAGSDPYLSNLINAAKSGNISAALEYIFSWKKATPGENYRVLYPIIEFFYPAMSDRGTPLTKLGNETYDNVAGSLFCYTPFIIFLVPALINSFKKKQYSPLIATGLFIISLFTPFCYYLFQGFTQAYSRWTLFVTASLIAYVGLYLDNFKEMPKWHVLVGGAVAFAGVFVAALCANFVVTNYSDDFTARVPIIIVMFIEAIYIAIVVAIIYICKDKKYINTILTSIISLEAVLMGAFVAYGHGLTTFETANNGLQNNNSLSKLVEQVKKDDPSYYRSISSLEDDNAKNDGMRNNYNGVGFFHSVYNYNVLDFADWTRMTKSRSSWSGTYLGKRLALDQFLGIKYRYYLKEYLEEKRLGVTVTPNVPLGYIDISEQYPNNEWLTFKNENHIDFAYTYDSIATYNSPDDEVGTLSLGSTFGEVANEELYLKYALLDYKDVNSLKTDYPDFNYVDYSNSNPSIKDATRLYNGATYVTQYHEYSESVKNASFEKILEASNSPTISKPTENNGRIVITISRLDNNPFPYDENGVIFYLSIPYKQNHKVDVYLVDENNNLVTFDRHNDNKQTDNTLRKKVRAFYSRSSVDELGNFVPAPKVSKIIIVPRYSGLYSDYPLAYEKYTTYKQNKLAKQLQYQISDVVYFTNKFTFKTDFDNERFICTQAAFDEGWSITAKTKDGEIKNLPIYKTQGGFVGFVSLKGDATYSMTYKTPYLTEGAILTVAGLIIYLATSVSFYFIQFKQRKREE